MDANSGWALDLDETYATSTDEGESWNVQAGSPQQFEVSASAVPEPETWAMLGMGAVILAGVTHRNRSRAARADSAPGR